VGSSRNVNIFISPFPTVYHRPIIEYHNTNIIPKPKNIYHAVLSAVNTATGTIIIGAQTQDRLFMVVAFTSAISFAKQTLVFGHSSIMLDPVDGVRLHL
jgi:hypothetical protein